MTSPPSRWPTLLLATCVVSCSGARVKLDVVAAESCPPNAALNTKGDCADPDAGGKIVQRSCCDSVRDCGSRLDEALNYYNGRLEFYMNDCQVDKRDVQPIGADFVMKDDSRVCSDSCQGKAELKVPWRTLKSWNLDACSAEPTYKQLHMMQGLVLALDTAWANCEALFEPVPPHQKKSVFVIDRSDSMSKPAINRMTRLDMVKEEFPKVINSLEEGQQFAVVSFSGTARYLKTDKARKPVWLDATPENKAAAVAWVKDLKAHGGTSILKALREIQADLSDYDAITLLADGQPTDCKFQYCLDFCRSNGGKCDRPVHTTLFMPKASSSDADAEKARKQLKLISEETGGKFREPFARR